MALTFTVTLTTEDTDYDILELVRGEDADFIDWGREVMLQAPSTNTAPVYVARDVTAVNGYELVAGVGRIYKGKHHLKGLTARSAGSAQQLIVDVTR